MKKINWCTGKGYVAFQHLLVNEKEITCESCKLAMEERGFDPEELRKEVESALEADRAGPNQGAAGDEGNPANPADPEQLDGHPAAKRRKKIPQNTFEDFWK